MRLSVSRLAVPQSVKGTWYGKVLFAGVFQTLVLALIAVGIFLIFHSHKNKYPPAPAQVTAAQEENLSKGPISDLLKQGDIEGYQASQRVQAGDYYYKKDYANAERIMLTTFSNIPAGKIDSSSYELMVSIEKGKGDQAQYKHYLQLLIPMLQSAGDTQAVSYYQGLLSKL